MRGSASQIDDIIDEAKDRAARDERVLITTLTKKMAEDLTDHLLDQGVRGALHAFGHWHAGARGHPARVAAGKYYVLVGINLLRYGWIFRIVSGGHSGRGQ